MLKVTSAKKHPKKGFCWSRQTGRVWEEGEPRALLLTTRAAWMCTPPVCLMPKFPSKLWKLILYTQNIHTHTHTSINRASTEMNQNSKDMSVKLSANYPSLFQELKHCFYTIHFITELAIFPEPSQESGLFCQDHLHLKPFRF